MRTLVIGMCNPHSRDPRDALATWPRGSAGHRLWQLSGMTLAAYARAHERVNLVSGPFWVQREARRAAEELLCRVSGRRVVVLGSTTWLTLGLPEGTWPVSHRGATWYKVPHPSGRCRAYNDPATREAVGYLLRSLAT